MTAADLFRHIQVLESCLRAARRMADDDRCLSRIEQQLDDAHLEYERLKQETER